MDDKKRRFQFSTERRSSCKRYIISLIATTVLCLGATAEAALLLLGGPVSNLEEETDGSGSITVLGITVTIPAGMLITTPTATLTLAEAANPAQLPGRTQPGFVGDTEWCHVQAV